MSDIAATSATATTPYQQFDSLYTLAKDASDRTRSALYVFLVANFALFITVFGINVYNRPVERLADFLEAVSCIPGVPDPKFSDLPCDEAILKLSDSYDLTKLNTGLKKDKTPLEEGDILKKRAENLVAEEIATKKVQIPVLGFTFDVDYLWLLTSYFGPLGMIIILASIENEVELIRNLKTSLAGLSPQQIRFKAILLVATQVLLSKPFTGWSIDTIVKRAKMWFLRSTFLLPILTQALIFAYDSGIDDLLSLKQTWGAFVVDVLSEFRRHPFLESLQLASELGTLILMVFLALSFIRTANDLRSEYAWFEERI